MPHRKLSDSERRRLTLAALDCANISELAREFGVSRAYVYKLRDEAIEQGEEEAEFWNAVVSQQREKEGK